MPSKQIQSERKRPWFALYVKPRHEKHISSALRGRGLEEFVPLYPRRTRSRITELPLFPGYVFCRFDLRQQLPVISVPGVFSIVGLGSTPVPVHDEEIENIRKVVESGVGREPWPELSPGQRVVMQRGPLQGVQGVLVETRESSRLVVSITLLNRAVAVEVENEWVIPADSL